MRRPLFALLALLLASHAAAQTFQASRHALLMPTTTIAGARTAEVWQEVPIPRDARAMTVQATLAYGAGGTTVKAWVQTSLDGGTTWVDVICFAFTTSAERVVSSVRSDTAVAANYTATDGTLADDTIKDGILGDRVRVKLTTTGTYTGATSLKVAAVFQ